MKPRNPVQAPVTSTAHDQLIARLDNPLLIGAWSNAMWNPEKRVRCVDCKKPIPYDTTKCTFCMAQQPDVPVVDANRIDNDRDGMPDVWEISHGLDPTNLKDAEADPDDDGATNIEECRASTNPRNPESCPELIATKMVLRQIKPDPFPLQFKSTIKLPDHNRFAINSLRNTKTYVVRLGEKVLGYDVIRYDYKVMDKPMTGWTQSVDVSVLTLRKGDKEISLALGQDVQVDEYIAELVFLADNSMHRVRVDGGFEVKGKKYTAIAIDSKAEFVVVKRDNDGRQFTIRKAASSD
jgi:hypothetical protein